MVTVGVKGLSVVRERYRSKKYCFISC